jgi:hypothetical protein
VIAGPSVRRERPDEQTPARPDPFEAWPQDCEPRPTGEIPAVDWDAFMSRLDEGLDRIDRAREAANFEGSVLTGRRRALAGALAAACVLLALMGAGRFDWPRREQAAIALPARPDAELMAVGRRHLDRSKLIVLGLLARDPQDPESIDWSYERELAQELWPDTRLYRMAAAQHGLTALSKVLGDLEVVLVQAAFTDDTDAATLERLQQFIRTRDLPLKIDTVARPRAEPIRMTHEAGGL